LIWLITVVIPPAATKVEKSASPDLANQDARPRSHGEIGLSGRQNF